MAVAANHVAREQVALLADSAADVVQYCFERNDVMQDMIRHNYRISPLGAPVGEVHLLELHVSAKASLVSDFLATLKHGSINVQAFEAEVADTSSQQGLRQARLGISIAGA